MGTEAQSKRRMIDVGETFGACHRLNAGSNRERRALAQHAARALRHGVYSRRRRTNRVQIGLERQRPAALARIFPPNRTLRLQHRHQVAPTVSTVRWAQERGGCVYSGAETNEGRKRNQCGRSQRQSQKSVSRCAVVGPPGSPGIHPIHGPISRWHGDFSSLGTNHDDTNQLGTNIIGTLFSQERRMGNGVHFRRETEIDLRGSNNVLPTDRRPGPPCKGPPEVDGSQRRGPPLSEGEEPHCECCAALPCTARSQHCADV